MLGDPFEVTDSQSGHRPLGESFSARSGLDVWSPLLLTAAGMDGLPSLRLFTICIFCHFPCMSLCAFLSSVPLSLYFYF